jgi:hypothetical protein
MRRNVEKGKFPERLDLASILPVSGSLGLATG